MGLEFRVLGDVEICLDGQPVVLGHARQLAVLMALIYDTGRPVPVEEILRRVWGEGHSRGERNTLHSYLSRLRGELAGLGGEGTITRDRNGYLLHVDPAYVDLHRFRSLVAEARAADDARAAVLFGRALGLWRGIPFGGLTTSWLDGMRVTLESERFAAALDRFDVELRLGHHQDLITELMQESVRCPLDERLAGQMILALRRCGRQTEADQHFARLQRHLAEELGVDPSPALRELSNAEVHEVRPAWSPAPVVTVPRQLPAHTPHFVGRHNELALLDESLRTPGTSVVVVSGPAGIGKTTLVTYWAHQARDSFPDGDLHINLRGFDQTGAAVEPSEALRGFLFALDVPTDRIPNQVDGQAALYRSLLGTRRMLVVLDNARDTEQVRPLLPGAGSSRAVVTSRRQLYGLMVREGARAVPLRPLTRQEARELLEHHLGRDRVSAERPMADELVKRAGCLPLALAVLAARAAVNPGFALRALTEELKTSPTRLDVFDGDDPQISVRAAISWSYRHLRPAAAHLFPLLSLHPGAEFGRAAAASLAGTGVGDALAELTGVHLVEELRPGRYALHDLVRVYAEELVSAEDDERTRTAALRRLLDHYLHTGLSAASILRPMRTRITPREPMPNTTTEHLPDYATAWHWFENEAVTMQRLISCAADAGYDQHIWQLAWTLADYLDRTGRWHDWVAVNRAALAAADRLADREALARAHHGLGQAFTLLRSFAEAHTHLNAALALEVAADDLVAQAGVRRGLALLADSEGHFEQALEHGEQALELSRKSGDHAGEAAALNQVGWYHCRLGDHARALSFCEQALARHRSIGDWTGEGVTWDSLGYVHHHLGQHALAVECYRHAIDRYSELGDRFEEAATLTRLADTHVAEADLAAARTALRSAIVILEELRHPDAGDVRAKLRTLT